MFIKKQKAEIPKQDVDVPVVATHFCDAPAASPTSPDAAGGLLASFTWVSTTKPPETGSNACLFQGPWGGSCNYVLVTQHPVARDAPGLTTALETSFATRQIPWPHHKTARLVACPSRTWAWPLPVEAHFQSRLLPKCIYSCAHPR